MELIEELTTRFEYHQGLGKFVNRFDINPRAKQGVEAGWLGKHNYWYIRINGKSYPAHRLVWLYHHGSLPNTDIDHIDGNRSNNKIENLRLVSRQQNTQSRHSTPNKLGVKGVRVQKNCTVRKYYAYIFVDGKQKSLGYHETIEAAAQAYDVAALQYFGDFAVLNYD